MKKMWQKLLADEAGVVLSSELALVGTVGVLGMVVGLDAVTCSVTSELNDLASAFGAIDQGYTYRGVSKASHARANGSGYVDRGDNCDCALITQPDVSGARSPGGSSQGGGFSQLTTSENITVNSAPIVREQVLSERVIDEVPVEQQPAKEAVPAWRDDDIIEEHIIRRRVRSDCDTTTIEIPKSKSTKAMPRLQPEPEPTKAEANPRRKR